MTTTSKKILFFGNEQLATGVTTGLPVVRALQEAGYEIVAIVVNSQPAKQKQNCQLEIANFAEQHKIPLLSPKNLSEIFGQLAAYKAHAGVLAAYGRLVPQDVIDLFPAGIINIHPSLLPKHRGSTPIESALLDGDTETGVSIMSLVKAMDAGPVYGQAVVALEGSEHKQGLADSLGELGATMLLELLPGIFDGSVVAAPQDDTSATYDELIAKADGQLDWSKPADQLEREVRAYAGWPGSRCTLGTQDVIVTAAAVAHLDQAAPGKIMSDDNQLLVATGKDWLEIISLKPAGKKEMSAADFLRGYRNKL